MNATTTRSTLALAKPANAFVASTVSVSTTVPAARRDAVSSGNAFRMTETIAAAKTAKRCQACGVRPAGIGANQIATAMPMHRSFFAWRRGSLFIGSSRVP